MSAGHGTVHYYITALAILALGAIVGVYTGQHVATEVDRTLGALVMYAIFLPLMSVAFIVFQFGRSRRVSDAR